MQKINFNYDTIERFGSYWVQIHEALQIQPKTLLEVGPGRYMFHDYLQRHGVEVTLLDIEPPELPGAIGTVTELPFQNNAFDVSVAFEVLEHIPFEDFRTALAELGRVARSRVIISIPDCRYYFRVLVNAPSIAHRKSHAFQLQFMVSFPRIFHRKVPPAAPGGHIWEMGRSGYPLGKVIAQTPSNLRLINHYRLWNNPFHHTFVFEKQPE